MLRRVVAVDPQKWPIRREIIAPRHQDTILNLCLFLVMRSFFFLFFCVSGLARVGDPRSSAKEWRTKKK